MTITIAFTAGLILGIAITLAALRCLEWRLDRDDRRDRGDIG